MLLDLLLPAEEKQRLTLGLPGIPGANATFKRAFVYGK